MRLAFLCAFRNWDVDLRRSFFLELLHLSCGRAVFGRNRDLEVHGAAVWEAVVVTFVIRVLLASLPGRGLARLFAAALLEI